MGGEDKTRRGRVLASLSSPSPVPVHVESTPRMRRWLALPAAYVP